MPCMEDAVSTHALCRPACSLTRDSRLAIRREKAHFCRFPEMAAGLERCDASRAIGKHSPSIGQQKPRCESRVYVQSRRARYSVESRPLIRRSLEIEDLDNSQARYLKLVVIDSRDPEIALRALSGRTSQQVEGVNNIEALQAEKAEKGTSR